MYGQDMFEVDALFFEVALALGDPDRREVEAGGGSRQSYFKGRVCLCQKGRLRAAKQK
jgi:hypothetical protein